MKRMTKEEFLENKDFYLSEIKKGKVFIYPTDTLYGLGTNALDDEAVKRIFEIKGRKDKALSVIAPSKDWIEENLEISELGREYLKKLPGPYTLIMHMKNPNCVSQECVQGKTSLGVRIPNSWFSQIVEELGIPFTATSANFSGEPSISKFEDFSKVFLSLVDYAIEDDENLTGAGSTVVDVSKKREEVLRE